MKGLRSKAKWGGQILQKFLGTEKEKAIFHRYKRLFYFTKKCEKSVEAAKKSRLQVKGFRPSCKNLWKGIFIVYVVQKETLCPPLSDRQCKSGGGVFLFQHLWWTLNSINKYIKPFKTIHYNFKITFNRPLLWIFKYPNTL